MATKKTESTGIRLKDKYLQEVVPALVKEFGYKNVNEVPKIEKIVALESINGVAPFKTFKIIPQINDAKIKSEKYKNLCFLDKKVLYISPVSFFKFFAHLKIPTTCIGKKYKPYNAKFP